MPRDQKELEKIVGVLGNKNKEIKQKVDDLNKKVDDLIELIKGIKSSSPQESQRPISSPGSENSEEKAWEEFFDKNRITGQSQQTS